MTAGELVGTIGVSILLLAFGLNLIKKITATSISYLIMNILGALFAGISSYLIEFWPFVVLEGVWTIASLMMLINVLRK